MKNFIIKIFVYSASRTLILIDTFFSKIFKRDGFLSEIHDIIETEQYYTKVINDEKITFFCPSKRTLSRVNSLQDKEPETINWIDNFKLQSLKKIIFWDIGANIGLYSIYACTKFENIDVVSFEPSTSNTRTLSRNISINNLYDKIKIVQLPLSDRANFISFFNETKFSEGGATSNFNSNINYTGKIVEKNKVKNRYNIYGTKIDYLITNNILDVPNFIKIDVDGIEHLILNGAQYLLKDRKLKEISIEMNPSYSEQYEYINKIMKDNGFKKIISTNARLLKNKDYKRKYNENVNVIFKRN